MGCVIPTVNNVIVYDNVELTLCNTYTPIFAKIRVITCICIVPSFNHRYYIPYLF